MFYVLFTYSKGHKERDFRGFRSEGDLIEFLHLEHERIDIVQIISVEKSYRLGLVATDELAKSALIEKEIDPVPFPEEKKSFMEEIIDETEEKEALKRADGAILEPGEQDDRSQKKHPYLRNKEKESSAMENIADEIEEEIKEETAEEKILRKNKEALKRADGAIVAAEKDLEKTSGFLPKPVVESIRRSYRKREPDKEDWPTCPECKKNQMAPWNKSGRCSECQQYKKKKKLRRQPGGSESGALKKEHIPIPTGAASPFK